MKRVVVHSLLIVALAGLGWGLQLTADFPFEAPTRPQFDHCLAQGWWGWMPAGIGCAGMVVAVIACFRAWKSRTSILPWLLLAPALCLVLPAIGFYLEVRTTVAGFEGLDLADHGPVKAWWWLAGHAYFAQILLARGMMWAWLGSGAAAAAAACTPAGPRKTEDWLRWAWPAAIVAAGVLVVATFVLSYSGVLDPVLHGSRPVMPPSRALQQLGSPAALLLCLPLLISVIAEVVMAQALFPLRPSAEELAQPARPALATARATGAIAILGSGACLALFTWLLASARTLLLQHRLTDEFDVMSYLALLSRCGGYQHFLAYRASDALAAALVLMATVAAAPLLVTAVRSGSRWLAPASLLAVSLLAFTGLHGAARSVVGTVVEPRCDRDCSEFDRVGSLLTLGRAQSRDQIVTFNVNDDWIQETENLRLPRAEAHRAIEAAVRLQIEQTRVLVDDVVVGTLDDMRPDGDHGPAALLQLLRFELKNRTEEARSVAARNPGTPFRGRLTVVADRSTPSGLLDELLTVAQETGFDDVRMAVAQPGSPNRPLVRTLKLHAHPAHAPPAGTPLWTAQLSPAESVLTSPTGQQWTATSIEEIALAARVALSPHRGTPTLWVYRSHDLTLQADLDARAALTGPGLFADAWSPPLTPQ